MAQINGNYKTVSLVDTEAAGTDGINLSVTGATADDLAVSIDTGTGNSLTGSSPFTTPVQSMLITGKTFRILVVYNTPDPNDITTPPTVVTLTA